MNTGSSPLARGLRQGVSGVLRPRRIIPARAGFTTYALSKSVTPTGSSPLARGLRVIANRVQDINGIIPARAGFTLADPWNPNDEPHYQTSFAFTADLALAPQSSDSVVVSQRSTRTPSEA